MVHQWGPYQGLDKCERSRVEELKYIFGKTSRGKSRGKLFHDCWSLRGGLENNSVSSEDGGNQAVDKGEVGVLYIDLSASAQIANPNATGNSDQTLTNTDNNAGNENLANGTWTNGSDNQNTTTAAAGNTVNWNVNTVFDSSQTNNGNGTTGVTGTR